MRAYYIIRSPSNLVPALDGETFASVNGVSIVFEMKRPTAKPSMLPALPAYEALTKVQLHALADQLLRADVGAIEQSVGFVEAETFGNWHGRARAMMARRLKHCPLTPHQQVRLVDAILRRLATGRFSEQFKDQLRLALHLDPAGTFALARSCESSPKAHIRRYAAWLLAHQQHLAP